MKKGLVFAVALSVNSLAFAIDGHNGIKFDMTQKQVEGMGFVCKPVTKEGSTDSATCRHMDMVGKAFGVPTENYEVSISARNGRVSSIGADLLGIRKMDDFLALLVRIPDFFPNEDKRGTHSHQGTYMRYAWRDNSNAGVSIFYASGVRGVLKDTMKVTFYSPASMSESDKIHAEREAKKATEKND